MKFAKSVQDSRCLVICSVLTLVLYIFSYMFPKYIYIKHCRKIWLLQQHKSEIRILHLIVHYYIQNVWLVKIPLKVYCMVRSHMHTDWDSAKRQRDQQWKSTGLYKDF